MSNALHFLQLMCFLEAPGVCVRASVCECVPLCFRLIIVLNEDVSEIIHECTDDSFPVHSQRWISVIMCIGFHSLQMFSSFRRNSSTTSILNSSAKAHNKTIISSTECVFYLDVLLADDEYVCVCFDWLQGELLSPCRCAGSVRHAHQHCLLKWISEKGSWSCELCNYRFNILPIHIKPPQQVNSHTLGFMIYLSGLLG